MTTPTPTTPEAPGLLWLTKADPSGWEFMGPFTTEAEATEWLKGADNALDWDLEGVDDDPDGWEGEV